MDKDDEDENSGHCQLGEKKKYTLSEKSFSKYDCRQQYYINSMYTTHIDSEL